MTQQQVDTAMHAAIRAAEFAVQSGGDPTKAAVAVIVAAKAAAAAMSAA